MKFCPICKEKANKTFCSLECHIEQKYQTAKNHIIQTGIASGKPGRRYIKEIQGHNCKICGISEWMGSPVPLVLDHINGNSNDCRIVNFRYICCNCDAQTPTFKNKNKGNGRASRRQRYAEGKSY